VVACLAPQTDGALVDWLKRWQQEPGRRGVSPPEERGELAQILAQTKLPSLILFHLGHAFDLKCDDRRATALFYAAAARRLEQELPQYADSPQLLAILRGVQAHMGSQKANISGFKTVLWPLINSHDKQALDTLYTIYSSYVRWLPADVDKALKRPVIHMKIGLAECLSLQSRCDEALDILQPLTELKLERGERGAADWAMALTLRRLNRHAEAIPFLERVAGDETHAHSVNALYSLAHALAVCGRADEAQRRFEEWIRRNPAPDRNAAISLAGDIEAARRGEVVRP
jgi:tetratricopeptide (TPR) repeat protein